jgi:hypothetical protein
MGILASGGVQIVHSSSHTAASLNFRSELLICRMKFPTTEFRIDISTHDTDTIWCKKTTSSDLEV